MYRDDKKKNIDLIDIDSSGNSRTRKYSIEYDEDDEEIEYGDNEPHPRKGRLRKILFWTIIVLIVAAMLIFIFRKPILKWFVKTRYVSEMNHETTAQEYTAPEKDATDNASDITNSLVNSDAKTFFYSANPVEDNYVVNILLVGTDVRVIGSNDYGNSDSTMLLSINTKTHKILLTSFMRDMYVYIPTSNVDTFNKLNYSHQIGGGGLLSQTISGMFKVKVNNFARIDFYGMMKIIDAVGGIDMTINDDELPIANGYINEMSSYLGISPEPYYFTASGAQHFDGMKAVAYARIRYVDYDGAEADFGRTARQRAIMTKIVDKCKSMSVAELDSFLRTACSQVSTNMSDDYVADLLVSAFDYMKYDFVPLRVPFDGAWSYQDIGGNDVILPDYKMNVELLLGHIYEK